MSFQAEKIYEYPSATGIEYSHIFFNTQKAIYSWIHTKKTSELNTLVFVCSQEKEAHRIFDEFSGHDWLHQLAKKHSKKIIPCFLPFVSYAGMERYAQNHEKWGQRLKCLSYLSGYGDDYFLLLCTTFPGLMQFTAPQPNFKNLSRVLRRGLAFHFDDLLEHLRTLQYREMPQVENQGEFSYRGGILDVFSPAHDLPVRIDFFADEVSSLRYFFPATQLRQDETEVAFISPLWEGEPIKNKQTEVLQRIHDIFIARNWDNKKRDALTNQLRSIPSFVGLEKYLPLLRLEQCPTYSHIEKSSSALILLSNRTHLEEQYSEFIGEQNASHTIDQDNDEPLPAACEYFMGSDAPQPFMASFSSKKAPAPKKEITPKRSSAVPTPISQVYDKIEAVTQKELGFDALIAILKEALLQKEIKIFFAIPSERDLERMQNLLSFYDLAFVEVSDLFYPQIHEEPGQKTIYLINAYFPHNFFDESSQALILSNTVFFGTKGNRKKVSSVQKFRQLASEMRDLHPGDLIVHQHFGIGRYLGLSTLKIIEEDYDLINIEYRDGDKLYLPIDRISLVQKFAAASSENPHLDKLGGDSWERKIHKARKAAEDMARELLAIEAERKIHKFSAYAPASETYIKFAADFTFEETEDQISAIADIEQDFLKDGLMDRLICGDVGFGKTEVAMRAAMRTVLEGFQVMVLAPTTVLCYQHLQTFRQRMEKFGVRIDQVNRFVRSKDIKRNIKDFSEGKLDILIGTHRILSSDVIPQSLGLIIVDEEQRFGVSHKEKIKSLKTNCHVLTLSATPIPRTLNMALMGLRDMSLIATPPVARLPVHTYVMIFNVAIIKQAINREIGRGGQVFYLHNRIKDMASIMNLLQRELPEVRFGFIHGGLPADELEQTLWRFLHKEFHVLVTTTIIESGIDMPNVNTLIVENADRFGLAELHQLRGRVGRSSQQAYCYLTTHSEAMTNEAHERLSTLVTYQDLGMGYHVAARDLEIRGAGELLGAGQSGHIAGIGVDYYLELLRKKVAEYRGETIELETEPELKLPIPAHIPKDFIKAENIRLSYYKALFMAHDEQRIESLRSEVMDRFGPLPREMDILLRMALLKQLLRRAKIASITTVSLKEYELSFAVSTGSHGAHINKLVQSHPNFYKIVASNRIRIYLGVPEASLQHKPEVILEELLKKIDPIIPSAR